MSNKMAKILIFVLLCILFHLVCRVMAHEGFAVHDVEHMKEHMHETVDYNNLTVHEQLFHYFRSHDADGNDKLDGCELIQSVFHYLAGIAGTNSRIYSDQELSDMVDPVLESDRNEDGLLEYGEFLSAVMQD